MEKNKPVTADTYVEENRSPTYEPPKITTYTDEELLNALGPAQASHYASPSKAIVIG